MSRKDWIKVDGKVGSIYRESSGRSSYDSVVFTYEVNGHICGGTFSSGCGAYKVGDSLAVKYDPADPDKNDLAVNAARTKWMTWIVVAVVIAILVFLKSR
jgi:hypothetical protein